MNINWFPGHMAKTRKLLKENLKLVDLVVELVDARLPLSSRNPELDSLAAGKPRVVVLNKSDLADDLVNQEWLKWYRKQGIDCLLIDASRGKGINELKKLVRDKMKGKFESDREKGRIATSVRMMIVGIPNVGKSTLINQMTGRVKALAEDRPGVTRGKQWVRINDEMDLLDTPGILWPKLEEKAGLFLAFTGAIRDDVLDTVELAGKLVVFLKEHYPDNLIARYRLKPEDLNVPAHENSILPDVWNPSAPVVGHSAQPAFDDSAEPAVESTVVSAVGKQAQPALESTAARNPVIPDPGNLTVSFSDPADLTEKRGEGRSENPEWDIEKMWHPVREVEGQYLLERIARKRGYFLRGGVPDLNRTSIMILDEFRGGKIGRISLERPDDREQDGL